MIRRVDVVKKMKQKRCRENKYDISGSFGIGWTTNTNREFYFELKDYDRVRLIVWREHINKRDGFRTLIGYNKETKKTVKMHVYLGYSGYDHVDRNQLNNLVNNLRHCTLSQNSMNQGLHSNNASGFTGVYWYKALQKWRAQIKKEGKVYCLGYFANKEDAIRARLKAEMEYFGEFSPQQHLFDKYDIKNNKITIKETTYE